MSGQGLQRWLVAAVNAIVDDLTLPPYDKLVALVLARHCNAKGVCWPWVTTIARECGLSVRTVQRCLSRLVAAGKIDREFRQGGRAGNRSSVFRVRMPMAGLEGCPIDTTGVSDSHPVKDPKGRDLGSRAGSAAPVSSETPIRRASARGGSKSTGDPNLDRALAVLAETSERRAVGPKLAGDEMHRLSQAIYAKDIAPARLVTAAEQYRDGRGPWAEWSTLRSGVTAILDDVEAWARASEPEPPRKQRAPKPIPPEPPSGVHRVADVTPLPDWLDRLDRRRKGGRG